MDQPVVFINILCFFILALFTRAWVHIDIGNLKVEYYFCRNILSLSTFYMLKIPQVSSVTVMSNSLDRFPCPTPTPRASSNSCPLIQWCHPTISSSVISFSCLQSFPASGSFPVYQLFTSGGQNIGASSSASVLPMNSQDPY